MRCVVYNVIVRIIHRYFHRKMQSDKETFRMEKDESHQKLNKGNLGI